MMIRRRPIAPWLGGGALALVLAASGCAASSDVKAGGSGGLDGGSNPDGAADSGGPADGPAGSGGQRDSGVIGTGGGSSSMGGSSAGPGGRSGAAGASGSAGQVGSACKVRIERVAPVSPSPDVDVGPDVQVIVHAVVSNARVASPKWKWSVTSPAALPLATASVDQAGADPGSAVSFQAASTGSYQIVAQVTNDTSCDPGVLLINGVHSVPSFNLRVTATGFPVQETRVTTASAPFVSVTLDPGDIYPIEPRAAGQVTVMPAFLRISSPVTTFDVEGYTSRGALRAALLRDLSYELLIVPDDPTFAPMALTANPETWRSPIVVDQGVPVSGLVLGPTGAPLANARMLLKVGTRPSTIGYSDANGMLTLWTRAGNMSSVVVPPAGSGLPELAGNVSDAGASLQAGGGPLLLTARYASVSAGLLTLAVRDPSGTAPVAGARVRISLHAAIAAAGTLTGGVPGGAQIVASASGSFDAEVVSDAGGTAGFGTVPTGDYDVVIVPPAGSSGSAITALSASVPPGGLARQVPLARKVVLSGVLAPLPAAAGASITALDKSPDTTAAVVTGTAGPTGAFALSVAPNRSYQLIVQPADASLGRTVLGAIAVGAADTALPGKTLRRSVALSGAVVGAGTTVGQALIQVFCAPSASCVDPTVSLAEATTRGDGTFNLVLPDPASP